MFSTFALTTSCNTWLSAIFFPPLQALLLVNMLRHLPYKNKGMERGRKKERKWGKETHVPSWADIKKPHLSLLYLVGRSLWLVLPSLTLELPFPSMLQALQSDMDSNHTPDSALPRTANHLLTAKFYRHVLTLTFLVYISTFDIAGHSLL